MNRLREYNPNPIPGKRAGRWAAGKEGWVMQNEKTNKYECVLCPCRCRAEERGGFRCHRHRHPVLAWKGEKKARRRPYTESLAKTNERSVGDVG